jgi:hypothetical protein
MPSTLATVSRQQHASTGTRQSRGPSLSRPSSSIGTSHARLPSALLSGPRSQSVPLTHPVSPVAKSTTDARLQAVQVPDPQQVLAAFDSDEHRTKHRARQMHRFDELQGKVEDALTRGTSRPGAGRFASFAGVSAISTMSDANDLDSVFGCPAFIPRVLERRDVRVQLHDDVDRRAPAFRHPQRVDQQQMMEGFDIVRETNSLLDSKSVVATVLHEHKEQVRARETAEAQVASWSAELMDRADYIGDDDRLRAMELDDELVTQGELAMGKAAGTLRRGLDCVNEVKTRLAKTVAQARTHEELAARRRFRTTCSNTDMTFDCCFSILEAEEDESDEDPETTAAAKAGGKGGPSTNEKGAGDGELLRLSERRLAKRNEALMSIMSTLENKDRELRDQKARYESRIITLEQQAARANALAEVSSSGFGFTQLWALAEDEEGDVETVLQQALIRAMEKAKAAVQDKVDNSRNANSDVVQAKQQLRALEGGLDGESLAMAKERNELRIELRKAKKAADTLQRQVALREDTINDKDETIRAMQGEVESARRVLAQHQQVLGEQDSRANMLRAEIAALQDQMQQERRQHAEDLRALEKSHLQREEDMHSTFYSHTKTAATAAKSSEAVSTVKAMGLETKVTDLETSLATLREQNRAATKCIEDLSEQLASSLGVVSGTLSDVVAKLAGCRSQIGSFRTVSDMPPLRECLWRGLGDATEALLGLSTHEAIKLHLSRFPDLKKAGDMARAALNAIMAEQMPDPHMVAQAKEIAALRDRLEAVNTRVRLLDADRADLRDRHRRMLLHMKKAVVNLVTRRDAHHEALPSERGRRNSGHEGSHASSVQELNDIFKEGFEHLTLEAQEKDSTIAERTEESLRSKHQLIELADSTALPVRNLLLTLATTSQIMRAVSSSFENAVVSAAEQALSDARALRIVPAADIALAQALLADIKGESRRRNLQLILDAVRTRARSKAQQTMFAKLFHDVPYTAKDIVRRRMHQSEVQTYRAFNDVYTSFASLHETKMAKMSRLAAICQSWTGITHSLIRSPAGTAEPPGAGVSSVPGSPARASSSSSLYRRRTVAVPGASITSPPAPPADPTLTQSFIAAVKSPALQFSRSGSTASPGARPADHKPSYDSVLPGPLEFDPLLLSASGLGDQQQRNATDHLATAKLSAAEGTFALLRRAVGDALARPDTSDLTQRFTRLVDAIDMAVPRAALQEVATLHRVIATRVADLVRQASETNEAHEPAGTVERRNDSPTNLVGSMSQFKSWREVHKVGGAIDWLQMINGSVPLTGPVKSSPNLFSGRSVPGVSGYDVADSDSDYGGRDPSVEGLHAGSPHPRATASRDFEEVRRRKQLRAVRDGLVYDEHGFARRTDRPDLQRNFDDVIDDDEDDGKRTLVRRLGRPSVVTKSTSTSTDVDLLTELLLRIVGWSPELHDRAMATAARMLRTEGDDGAARHWETLRRRNVPGARQLPIGFSLLSASDRCYLETLHRAVKDAGSHVALSAPLQASTSPTGADNAAAASASVMADAARVSRHVEHSGSRRPTSASADRQRGRQGPLRGGAVEMPPGAPPMRSPERRTSPTHAARALVKPRVALPVVTFPPTFVVGLNDRSGTNSAEAALYLPHRHRTDRLPSGDPYAIIEAFFDESHKHYQARRNAAVQAAEKARSIVNGAVAPTDPVAARLPHLQAERRIGSAPAQAGALRRAAAVQQPGAVEDGPDWTPGGGAAGTNPAPVSKARQLIVTAERSTLRTRARVE